jgi:hypothetical protein
MVIRHAGGTATASDNRTPASAAWRRPSTQLAHKLWGPEDCVARVEGSSAWGRKDGGQFGVLERYTQRLQLKAV